MTISEVLKPRYRDTRYWYPILTPISGYHVTYIGTPNIDPDIDPDIGYDSRYRVLMSRYRVTPDTVTVTVRVTVPVSA